MSDTARDLLVRGIAAAQGNSLDEARYYLEWVLITDADNDQEMAAWYWLSRITDDPAQKRNCLEHVLAINPMHPEARRDLAILDGRLKPEDIVDHRKPVEPVKPSGTVTEEEIRRYRCPKCGAKATYDNFASALSCNFCGYREGQDGGILDDNSVDEQDWVAAIYTARGHRWELPTLRTLTCQGCGASVTMQPSFVSGECAFCGSSHVVESHESRELIQPEGVIPFALDAAAAHGHARRWIEEMRFRPEDLDELAAFSRPRPVYLPVWTFDMGGVIKWSAVISKKEYGQVKTERETGSQAVNYDDLTVPASLSLTRKALEDLEFDTRAAEPYSPEMLASWPAQIYTASVADASLDAREHALKQVRKDVWEEVGQATSIQIDRTGLAVMSYKLLLVPVWLADYTYKGTTYRVVVNGHTGKAHGEAPRNIVMRVLGSIFD